MREQAQGLLRRTQTSEILRIPEVCAFTRPCPLTNRCAHGWPRGRRSALPGCSLPRDCRPGHRDSVSRREPCLRHEESSLPEGGPGILEPRCPAKRRPGMFRSTSEKPSSVCCILDGGTWKTASRRLWKALIAGTQPCGRLGRLLRLSRRFSAVNVPGRRCGRIPPWPRWP